MSETSQPIQVLDVFNKQNFHTGLASEFVKFPKAQSTVTMPNGVKFGDGTFQNSASTGSSLTVQEASGPLIVTEVDTIKVSNSTLVDNGDGSVTITTGGGGGGGGSLTVQDNATTASSVSTIILPNNTLTNNGAGSVTIQSPTLSQVMAEGATASAQLDMNTFDIINLPGLTFASSNYVLTCSKITTVSNNNIVFNPGSGHVEIDGTSDGRLRLRNTSNAYVGLQAPPGSFTTHDIILPTSSGTSGQLLQSNGSGNALTWVTQTDPDLDAVLNATTNNTTTQNLTAAVITASTNFSGPLSGDVTGDLTGDVTGEIKTSTQTRGATLTTTSTTDDTLTLNTAGFTYETFDYSNTSTGAITITTLSLTGTQRNNSQYVVSIDNTTTGTGTFSFSTTFTGAKINYTTQVDIPNGQFGILTIYYKDSSTIFASASVFS